jgi:hypothetical protein
MLKKSSGIAIVFVMLVVGAFYYDRYQKDHQFKKGGEFAQFLATEAVRDAKENNHTLLDYTPESIKIVESILGSVHDQYVKNPDSVSARGLGSAYGAYVGEVIRRSENGAKWERDDPVAGEKSYPLRWGGRVSFPMSWCYKRIVNGPEDNVWNKYSSLRQHADAAAAKKAE